MLVRSMAQLLVGLLVFSGCSSREPAVHRTAGATCDSERPTGDAAPPEAFGTCTSDADCTDGANGRCNGSRGGWRCTYDECFADADCDGASACECENGGLSAGANTCLPGNCRTDADCASGFCSPTLGPCGTYDPTGSERANTSPAGYYCHTPEDECVDDSDCRDGDAGALGAPYCAFDPVEARWLCADTHCVG